jgi:hypothetical protein
LQIDLEQEWIRRREEIRANLPPSFADVPNSVRNRIIHEWYYARIREEQDDPRWRGCFHTDEERLAYQHLEERYRYGRVLLGSDPTATSSGASSSQPTYFHYVHPADSLPDTDTTPPNLPPITNYPQGIMLTQDEWTLGRDFWWRSRFIRHIRLVDGVRVEVPIAVNFLDKHEEFYRKFVHTQLRRRDLQIDPAQTDHYPVWRTRNIMHSPNTHEVGRISSYWIREHPPLDSCFVDFPHHVASKFPIVRLRHFYSDDTMAGICVGKPLIADTELSIADYHARHHNLDTPFN